MDPSGPPVPGGGDRPSDGRPLTAAQREEYERLREASAVRHRHLRYAAASVLLLLAFLLAPVSVVASWVDDEVSDTDRYVQTVAPIASEPAVQSAVTEKLTSRIVGEVDVAAITESLAKVLKDSGAPPKVVDSADLLTGPLKNALDSAVRGVVTRVVTSDQFEQIWENANRRAHAVVVKVLTGQGSTAVQTRGDTIELDVGVLVEEVKQRLVDSGFGLASQIPEVDRTIPLVQVDKLDEAQDAMRLLDVVGTWLPVVAVALAALAVWTAPAHRMALMAAAIGVGVMMILLLVALAVMRRVYLDSVPPTTLPQDAAAAIYDTLVRFLREGTRTVLVVAVITALAAYLYGPGRGARFVRAAAAKGTGATGRAMARAGGRTGAVGRWLRANRRWTTGVVIAAGVLALVLWNHPTPGAVALVLGLVVLVLLVLGVLAAASGEPEREPEPRPTAGGPGDRRPRAA
ncbi:hypothetical protein [Streptomyces sp. GC420]|uniref:hypothetical protein n=1 Tax=Streptomyces sp. GC420 TaxID=2697568 RepID=UPI0014151597|nr:hypothetical protein [Streptomyces sp. GC420]NBM19284.1 hypothetical protein [Streptomyces sp. GC420]